MTMPLAARVAADGLYSQYVNPQWVRLEKEEHAEFGLQKLALVSRGRKIGIAAFLGPDEKADQRARLVGRYPAGHSEQDARHAPSFSRTE